MQPPPANRIPETLASEPELEEFLTRPRPELIGFIRSVASPLVILGAGGKMGPTLAVLARRAADAAGHTLEIVAVSRFSDARARDWREARRVRARACDLLDSLEVARLPDTGNVLYLVGSKFGTARNPVATWAANTVVPMLVAERYAGTRISALSTGNVYPLVSAGGGGAVETDPLTPVGEYANAAVARERLFEFFSARDGTRIVLLRLFYALDLRYGVLRDIADRIWGGVPVDLANGWFNCIWQGDANEAIIRSLSLATSPAAAFNLTSPDIFRVRTVAERLGALLNKRVTFAGTESGTALLANTSKLRAALGDPPTELETMLRWTAAWIKRGGRSLGKPTHFEVRDGSY